METTIFTSRKVIILLLSFVIALNNAFAQTIADENVTATPWYKIPWLWIAILVILAGIVVYITFWKSK